MKLLWRISFGSVLILSGLLIWGVIDHHERLGYGLMALAFAGELAVDLGSSLRRRSARR